MSDQQQETPEQQIIINTAWENHIREFFTARLSGNESKFNFTEILANFPFLLEWVIQNRPQKPVEVYFEEIWPFFDARLGSITKYHSNTYDLEYITAHPDATPELIMKYPGFEWSFPVIKYKFRDAKELEVLAPLLAKPENLEIPAMSKIDYDKIVNFKPVVSPIDTPNRQIDEVYIPALFASGGDLDYVCYPPGYNPEAYKQALQWKKQNPYLCDVAFIGGQCVAVAYQKSPFKIRQFAKDIWNYSSFSPLVPWEFIDRNRQLPWNWQLVFRSRRFAPEFFMTPEGEKEAWDGGVISGYRRITFGLIDYLGQRGYKLDWTTISYCDFREEKTRFIQSYGC